MDCVIYKGSKKADTYLFVRKKDDFSEVPQTLLDMLGELEFVMDLGLHPERTLSQSDPEEVRNMLKEQGYFLQMPPPRPELQ
jgi:uncharacterized protein YcgL (UPF0745 family)